MPHILKNSELYVEVDLPHEGYRFSRFDWTGKIRTIRYHDIPLTTSEYHKGPQIRHHGAGLYNEFDIGGPQGYELTKHGSYFDKIGIGSLRKEDDAYDFLHPYSIIPAKFDFDSTQYKIVISCTADNRATLSYHLRKTIQLINNELKISYVLTNKSPYKIITTEYVHNFLAVNHEPMTEDYKLQFPFIIDTSRCDEVVNPDEVVRFTDDSVSFRSTPSEEFFFSELTGEQPVSAQWHLSYHPMGLNITETGDFNAYKINLWGSSHVICPELFHKVEVRPNETAQWSRTYHIWQ